MAGRRRARGFTLIELVVVVALVAILVALAVQRLFALRVDAERAAFGQVVNGLRAATSFELLARLSAGRDDEIAELAGANPMAWLLEAPHSYLGELRDTDAAEVAPGRWWFDPDAGVLHYRVRYADRFESSRPGPAQALLRVVLDFEDRDGDGRFDAGLDGVGGARLEPVEEFAWRDAPRAARPR